MSDALRVTFPTAARDVDLVATPDLQTARCLLRMSKHLGERNRSLQTSKIVTAGQGKLPRTPTPDLHSLAAPARFPDK